MRPQTIIPINTSSQNRPTKTHHPPSYYAHRVHDSLTTRFSKIICAIFLTVLLSVGILAFILWLSLRPHRPRFHVRSFSIPALNQENGFEGARLTFYLTARNPNQYIGIYYGTMSGTVYYKDQSIGATPLLSPFYQSSKNTTWIHGDLSGATLTVNNEKWKSFLEDRAKGMVFFRLDLRTTIKFRISTWKSRHHHRMHASCHVGVGQDGLILPISTNKRCSVYFI